MGRRRIALIAGAVIAAGAACSSSASPQGAEGQHCFRNGTCDVGLICLSDLCVQPPDGGMGGRGGTGGRGGSGGGTGGTAGGGAGTGGTSAGAGGNVGGGGGSAGTSGGAGGTGGAAAGSGGTTGGSSGTAGTGGATGGSAGAPGIGGGGTGGATAGTGGGGTGATAGTGGGGTGGSGPTCGNGVKEIGEACDDHNRTTGDGCSALCQIEVDWLCLTPGSPCTLTALCGDGVLAASEVCDDGNTMGSDGCAADCRSVETGWLCPAPGRRCVPRCGDGMRIGGEQCDDGNTTAGDGCSPTCLIEPGASCIGTPSVCTKEVCGNGVKEGYEGCDCGTSSTSFPVGCKGPNGLFFGDATGCSKTCTKEPSCRTGTGTMTTRACDVSCGNGNVETSEQCDDGNSTAGDGCSPTCQIETGFGCAPEITPGTANCVRPGNSGQCLQLPVIYRDFKSESVSGGHPDFFYLGATVANPVTESGVQGQAGAISFSKRFCVPNSSGPAKKNDATNRCWDVALPNLDANGKPAFNTARAGGTNCDCQFIDWSHDSNGGHVPGISPTQSPLAGLPTYVDGASGHPMYRGPAPVVTSAQTFGQWWVDSTYTGNTHTVDVLEMASIGGGQYQYSSQTNSVLGGFFPLDPPGQFSIYGPATGAPGATRTAANGEALLCNLWPYWYSAANFGAGNSCRADQYLYPPNLFTTTIGPYTPANYNNQINMTYPNGNWYTNVQGWFHDIWFTNEARTLFTFNGQPFSLQFVGSDDMFVFINGTLVVDLGGIHQSLPGRVDVSATGMAIISEGGSLNAAGTGILPCPSADPYTTLTMNGTTNADGSGHLNCTITNCDCRTRTVNLGLQSGRTYEIAVFGANRHPGESGYQLTLSGLQANRSACSPRCGDGILSTGEECDCGDVTPSTDPLCKGMTNSGAYGGCTSSCRLAPRCGDGVADVSVGEECDNGANNTAAYGSTFGCAPGCRFPHFCGDGLLDSFAGEQCDLGTLNGTTGSPCSAICRIATP